MSSDPKHVAIILDGNRRWAKKQKLQPWRGHEEGASKVGSLMRWARDLGVKELTLYAFSTENFNRPKREVDFLMNVFLLEFEKLRSNTDLERMGIRITAIGRLGMFPPQIQKALFEIMERTKHHKNYTVNFALAYGGRQEITDAVKRIVEKALYDGLKPEDVTEDLITENLYLSREPDIVIRPGGEKRVSNFLIWQSNYSEWFFIDKFWPEFTKNDLKKIIRQFRVRQRRFGA